eukprot:3050412-Lingulodinium_polyedra.AAC.1
MVEASALAWDRLLRQCHHRNEHPRRPPPLEEAHHFLALTLAANRLANVLFGIALALVANRR